MRVDTKSWKLQMAKRPSKRRENPDFILLDLRLPDLNGIEAPASFVNRPKPRISLLSDGAPILDCTDSEKASKMTDLKSRITYTNSVIWQSRLVIALSKELIRQSQKIVDEETAKPFQRVLAQRKRK